MTSNLGPMGGAGGIGGAGAGGGGSAGGAGEAMPNPFTTPAPDLPPALPGFGVQSGASTGISSHTALLLLVLLISAAAIFGMRKIGMGSLAALASGGPSELDMSAVPKIDDSHTPLLNELSKSRTDNQVAKDQLQRNPFLMMVRPKAVPPQGVAAMPDLPEPKDDAEAQRQARVRELLGMLSAMELNGIMGGSRPVAKIDGRLFRAGEVVGGTFTVVRISGKQVELEADGERFVLEMGAE